MTGFVLTNKAKSDLKSIGIYTKNKWGEQQRNRYLTAFDKAFRDLAKDHLKGCDCGEIRSGYRKYEVGRHVIFYREIDASLIEMVRVLHQRMDVESRLAES
jgi:toxin ParE1/3/4